MSMPVDVLATLRQMHVNSNHFRNGLPVLADHHEGESERETVAIAAIERLIAACEARDVAQDNVDDAESRFASSRNSPKTRKALDAARKAYNQSLLGYVAALYAVKGGA